MILHCLRHGRTEDNLAGRYNRAWEDRLADPTLLAQIAFEAGNYEAIYVSALPRCIETAQGLKLTGWREEPRLIERNLGLFEGLTAAEAARRHAAHHADFVKFDADFVMPDGESRAQHLARLSAWVEEVGAAHRGEVLAVTHGGVIDFLYRWATRTPLHGGDRIYSGDNLALSVFDVSWPKLELLEFSRPIV